MDSAKNFNKISLIIVLCLGIGVHSRSPGLYWPSPPDEHPIQTRNHLDEASLARLSDSELETLLYLLDKSERSRPVVSGQEAQRFVYAPVSSSSSHHQQQPHQSYYYGSQRNKRTGAHHLGNNAAILQKKAIDWSDYFGIDKREIKDDQEPSKSEVLEGSISATNHPSTDAKDDAEREKILNEFYSNMAMAGNIKRRKRSIRNNKIAKQTLDKAGDDLIWDALKLTGSHRDQKMSREEFKQFKKELVRRISAAYDLEKLRQILEGNINNFGSNKNEISARQ